jgi:intracellular septation protein
MTQLLDFVPILLFVAVFFTSDIYYATAALMIGVTVQALVFRLLKKPLSREFKMTLWASLVFGALTLVFRNEAFIQWKPTIVNWLLAGSLVGSFYVGQTNLLKKLLGKQLSLVDEVWTRLNFGWAFGFFLAGALNLVVAYNFSMEFWVSYKLFGGFALTFLYIVITMIYLSRKGFLEEQPAEAEPAKGTAGGSADRTGTD